MPRELVVDDEKKLLASLKKGLVQVGHEVITAATGKEGYYSATTEKLDGVILDLMQLGRDGL